MPFLLSVCLISFAVVHVALQWRTSCSRRWTSFIFKKICETLHRYLLTLLLRMFENVEIRNVSSLRMAMWQQFHETLRACLTRSFLLYSNSVEKQVHLMYFKFVWSIYFFPTVYLIYKELLVFFFPPTWVMRTEFWKQIPPNEPYRVVLGNVRDKLYNTRERSRQLLANGKSDIPEDSTFTKAEQVPSLSITFSLKKYTVVVTL